MNKKKPTIDKTLNRKLRLSNINSHTTSVRSLHFTTHMLFYSNFLDRARLLTQKIHKQIEVIATEILRSSSQSGWPLRNIHISIDNGSFPFYLEFIFPLSQTRLLLDLTIHVSKMAGIIKEAGTAYHSRAPGFIAVFCGLHVAHLFSFLCCVLFMNLHPVSCVPNVVL